MNLSVGVVAFLVSLVLIMRTADSATLNKNPSFRDQARLGANKQPLNKPSSFNKPSLERQASSNFPFEPAQTLNHVNEGVASISQATPVPLAVKIIQHVKELLQALNINIYNLANNLILRIPVETRRNIVQGLAQIQSYIQMVLERASKSNRPTVDNIRQPENSYESPAPVETLSNEIINEDEMDAPSAEPVDTEPNTEAASDEENQDEDDETPPPPPPPPALSKNQRRRLNRQQNRQNSQG